MSNIYIQEPPTNGKVLLITSAGDIDVELWSKEAPKACRNFVQLCMEGYYDGTVFHRVVKDFIVQGGDPTGTGEGGESIYGAPFKDEFHTRLRFVRRGLVAMANAGQNDNGSQFFFTMGPTQELQNKHTIFGKVTGNTVYNMLKLQDVEVDENERPTGPHKIKSTHILSIPFDDIVPRTKKKEHTEGEKKVKSKSKATKNFKLLSFGEEAEEDEEEVAIASKDMKGKSKSSHDLTDDPSLSSVQAVDDGPSPKRTKLTSEDEEEMDKEYDDKMKERVRQKLKQDNTASQKSEIKEKETKDETSKLSRSEELRQEAKRLKKELKGNNKIKTESPKDEQKEKAPINDVMASYIADKQKYKEARKNIKKGPDREAMTLALLSKFQSKLSSVKRLAGDYSDDNDEEDEEKEKEMEEDTESDLSWMRHKLHFEDHSKKVLDANVHDVDRYEIYDPRNPLTKRRRENDKKTVKK